MKWIELSVLTTESGAEAVANLLHSTGAGGVVIEDEAELHRARVDQFGELYELDPADFPASGGVLVKAYLPESNFQEETIGGIRSAIRGLAAFGIEAGSGDVQTAEVDEEDWANSWKQYYNPVRISDTLTIVPSWERYEPAPGERILLLDPGMAFGTGTHATTAMCLQALERALKPGMSVIDIGTGSGVLSIGAALLGARRIYALDLDEVAVRAARENIALNGVGDRVEVAHGNLLDAVSEPADIVVANILAEVILSFTDDAFRAVKPGGLYIASGIIGAKQEAVQAALKKSGFSIEEAMLLDDWVAIIARKPQG